MEDIRISLYSIVGDSFCVAAEDGEKVFDKIRDALTGGKRVVLSFQNVGLVTSAFLNSAVGKLYGEFDHGMLRENLSLADDVSQADRELLRRVVETAKMYFADPERLQRSVNEILGA